MFKLAKKVLAYDRDLLVQAYNAGDLFVDVFTPLKMIYVALIGSSFMENVYYLYFSEVYLVSSEY